MANNNATSWVAIVVSVLSLVISVIVAVAAVLTWFEASESNTIAQDALDTSKDLAREDTALRAEIAAEAKTLEQQLFRLEQQAKIPAIDVLRFAPVNPTEYLATIQNTGQRYAALFEIECRKEIERRHGGIDEPPRAVVPVENRANVIEVFFSEVSERVHTFIPTVVIGTGEVVTFRLTVTEDFDRGEFVLRYGKGREAILGDFRRPASESDDAFSIPPESDDVRTPPPPIPKGG